MCVCGNAGSDRSKRPKTAFLRRGGASAPLKKVVLDDARDCLCVTAAGSVKCICDIVSIPLGIVDARSGATARDCARNNDGADGVMIRRLFLFGDAGDCAPDSKVDGVIEILCLVRYFVGAGKVERDGCNSDSVALSDDDLEATILGMLE